MAKLPDTRARLAASLKELIQAVRQRQELFEIYFTYRTQKMVSLKRQDAQVSGLQRLETEIIRLGREQGEISPDLPIEFLEALYEFTFIMVAQNFYRDPQRFDAESTIACCVDLFMDGAAQNRKD
jgi:transcriptional accessory protein Tex/SPT6